MAETWDELSPAQLLRAVAILHGRYTDVTQPRLEVLFGVSRPRRLRLIDVHLAQILWLTDFVLAAPVTRTLGVAPALRPAWYWPCYFAPAEALANVSFLESAFADAYLVAYCQARHSCLFDPARAALGTPIEHL